MFASFLTAQCFVHNGADKDDVRGDGDWEVDSAHLGVSTVYRSLGCLSFFCLDVFVGGSMVVTHAL